VSERVPGYYVTQKRRRRNEQDEDETLLSFIVSVGQESIDTERMRTGMKMKKEEGSRNEEAKKQH
jgi:hypothetical protein